MRKTQISWWALGVALGLWISVALSTPAMAKGVAYRLSGPYQHDNLSVTLIHANTPAEGAAMMTLSEAIEAKLVVVRETGTVNRLTVANRSPDKSVFIQAGEIVKGGQQDRTLSRDLVLPPNSGDVPIDAFCVEAGRWNARGGEAVGRFETSNRSLPSKELKLAARAAKSQDAVWQAVAEAQRKLSEKLGKSVRSEASQSSLQLSLEDEALGERVAAFQSALATLADAHPDAIGMAYAINGEVNSAEVYASHGLFARQWPRLLQSAATEAVAERPDRGAFAAAPSVDTVDAFLREAEAGVPQSDSDTPRLQSRESDEAFFFESRDGDKADDWVHRSYLKK